MRIVLTGTPGTGKTSVAEELDYETIHLTEFLDEKDIGTKKDGEREVDTEEVVEALEEAIDVEKDVLVEGHLTHHLPADYCIVLRCRPDELRERLSERDYSDEKIEENVEAEVLDIILSEAAGQQDKIIEIDTTERDAEDVAEEVVRRIREDDMGYGDVDWTEYL